MNFKLSPSKTEFAPLKIFLQTPMIAVIREKLHRYFKEIHNFVIEIVNSQVCKSVKPSEEQKLAHNRCVKLGRYRELVKESALWLPQRAERRGRGTGAICYRSFKIQNVCVSV